MIGLVCFAYYAVTIELSLFKGGVTTSSKYSEIGVQHWVSKSTILVFWVCEKLMFYCLLFEKVV